MAKTVAEILRQAAQTFEDRHAVYGDNYKDFGPIMAAMFKDGLTLKTAEDWQQLGIFVQIMNKATRYANTLTKGGHQDSAHDGCVYFAMLEEMTK